jgi:hypothetical protein
MKKIIFLSVIFLFPYLRLFAQSEFITFPVEGSVFQASNGTNGTYAFTFGGQAKETSGLRWQLEKKSGNNCLDSSNKCNSI